MSSASSNITRAVAMIAFAAIVCGMLLSVVPGAAFAHGDEIASSDMETYFGVPASELEATIHALSVKGAIVAGIVIAVVTIISLLLVEPKNAVKRTLFSIMLVAIILPTTFFGASTVYLNVISDTGGPVHWHLDFSIFVCGQEVQLAGPIGRFSNKVGSPTFHHHDDNRIHVEGTVVNTDHVELEDFFTTIGGRLTDTSFTLPLEDGTRTITNGEQCPDGTIGKWNAYLFEVPDPDSDIAHVSLLNDYPHYLMKPESIVPPADCVVFEFGEEQVAPAEACTFYDIAFKQGDLRLMMPTN